MRAAATLFWQSFTGTRLSAVLSSAGVVLLAAGCISQLIVPSWTLGNGMNRQMSLAAQALVTALPWLAVLTLFLATSAQPRVVRRLVFGHAAASLPNVRREVLIGVLAVAAAVSLAAATPAALFFVGYPIEVDVAAIFRRSFVIAFVNFGLLYVAFLALAYLRGIWFFVGPALIFVALSVPAEFLNSPDTGLDWRVLAGSAGWLAYAGLILAGDRLVAAVSGARLFRARRVAAAGAAPAPEPATAIAQLFGADRPWIVALAQCLPVVLALWFAPDRGFVLFAIVLFSLVIFSALNGARSVLAAPRSRALWLRSDSTLAELFRRAEQVYLSQAGFALAVAILLLVVIGVITDFPALIVAIAVVLLVLATAAGLYLGLVMTRGLPLGDALLAALTMGLLITTTVLFVRGERISYVLTAGGMLVALTIALRFLARSRWARLDWMQCRPPDRT